MSHLPVPMLRSISGRLYAVIGVMLAAMIATNVQTVIYSNTVTAGAGAVATVSIDGLSAVDNFDDLVDQHRRTLTAATEKRDPAAAQANADRLFEIEQQLTGALTLSGAASASSHELLAALGEQVAELKSLARSALVNPPDGAEAAHTPDEYVAFTNEVEENVTVWKARMREAIAVELATMTARADAMRRLYLAISAGACVLGGIAILISRGVLSRLRRLTSSMLSLAAGNITVEVPLRGGGDEIGRLANALEVFREHACRVTASEANMAAVIENMVEGIALLSADNRLMLHNHKFVEMLGLPRRDHRGATEHEILDHLSKQRHWPDDAVRDVAERFTVVRSSGETATFDVDLPDNVSYTVTAAMLPNHALLVSTEDVSERRASAARILHLAYHDTLTGLPNRGMFQKSLAMAVDDAMAEEGFGVTLLLCDLDRFKEVNDTYGHPVGDELLREVARRMRETMRKTDILARLGGDEFAVVHLIGLEPQEVHNLAERIVAALQTPFEIQGNLVSIGVSIGIASAPLDASSPAELMKHADLALYAAKDGGRNMYVVYNPSIADELQERRDIEIEMRNSLDAEDFCLRYQSQMNLATRRIIGFEALARWHHPVRGAIPPALFIPIAEESGLIIRLGEWVLRKACFDAAAWGGDTIIAVNVSARQLHWEGFVNSVGIALRDSGLPPHRLELEVTETAMLDDGEKMLDVLRTLRTMNVRLSLDDFGTGYSALSYLQRFPFDKIKIDQSFVHNLGSRGESDAIIRAVASLGKNLGIATIAEGVETEDQAEMLLRARCGEAQGFLFGHPVSVADIVRLLAEQDPNVNPSRPRHDVRALAIEHTSAAVPTTV